MATGTTSSNEIGPMEISCSTLFLQSTYFMAEFSCALSPDNDETDKLCKIAQLSDWLVQVCRAAIGWFAGLSRHPD